MLSRGVYYYSRVLATTVGRSNIPCTAHRRSWFPATFSVTEDARRFRRSVVFERRMASGNGEEKQQKFPPQRQDSQPGREQVMDPVPQATSRDYKPANKLQVLLLYILRPAPKAIHPSINFVDNATYTFFGRSYDACELYKVLKSPCTSSICSCFCE